MSHGEVFSYNVGHIITTSCTGTSTMSAGSQACNNFILRPLNAMAFAEGPS